MTSNIFWPDTSDENKVQVAGRKAMNAMFWVFIGNCNELLKVSMSLAVVGF